MKIWIGPLAVVACMFAVAPANADTVRDFRDASAAQYSGPSADAPSTPAAAGTESDSAGDDSGGGVAGDQSSGNQGSGSGPNAEGTGPGSTAGAGAGAGAASPGVAASRTMSLLLFGTPSQETVKDVQAAAVQAGLTIDNLRASNDKRLKDFLASDLGKRLGADAEAVGRALGLQADAPDEQAQQAFAALFGDEEVTNPIQRLVLSDLQNADDETQAFVRGLLDGAGETGAVLVYVERSTTKDGDSAISRFIEIDDDKKLGVDVSSVDNIDQPNGKAALVAILDNGAEGHFGTKDTADSELVNGEVQAARQSATFDPAEKADGLSGATPYLLLLALVIAGIAWSVAGLRSGRLRQRRTG